MKKTAEVRHLKSLLAEIKILSYVGKHQNLVCMVGACTKNMRKREIYLIMDLCENGSLLRFLKQSRGICVDLFKTNRIESENNKGLRLINLRNDSINVLPCINTFYLLQWSYDIASALEYLGTKKVCT
jgi:FMS-like tyrosine kinase 1